MSESKALRIRDYTLAVASNGPSRAPYLTFLHSLAASGAMWDEQARVFGETFRVLRIDARGHGQSQAVAGPYEPDSLVDDTIAVWDLLGIAQSAVVGLSLGGITAAGLGLRYPERVTRLVVADCRLEASAAFLQNWQVRRRVAQEDGMAAVADVTIPTWLTAQTCQKAEIVARLRHMILATSLAGYLGVIDGFPSLDYARQLDRLSTPTLFICGSEDGAGAMAAEMHSLSKRSPCISMAVIDSASHLSNVDQPEHFNHLVREFNAAAPH